MASTASSIPRGPTSSGSKDVSGILTLGGIVGTTNRSNPFRHCVVENGQEVVRDISDLVIANARRLGIDAVISIGGGGSQAIALELFQKGMQIVGVPKTIDNDLCATDVTFGSRPRTRWTRFTLPAKRIIASWLWRSWAAIPVGSPWKPVLPAALT
jgi:Phosphofructokinase